MTIARFPSNRTPAHLAVSRMMLVALALFVLDRPSAAPPPPESTSALAPAERSPQPDPGRSSGANRLRESPATVEIIELGEPEISPDGEWMTFYARLGGEYNQYEIFVSRIDGSEMCNLTRHPAVDQTPTWSPDGTEIAFTSNRKGTYQNFIMNRDGSNVRPILQDNKDDRGARWSRGSNRLAFVSYRYNFNLYTVAPDGSELTALTNFGKTTVPHLPTWSSEGDRVSFTLNRAGKHEIVVLNTQNLSQVTVIPFAGVELISVAWAPDDDRLAYSARRPDGKCELRIRDLASGADRLVAESATSFANLSWFPDGKRLIYETQPESRDVKGFFFVLSLANGKSEMVLAPGQHVLECPGKTRI